MTKNKIALLIHGWPNTLADDSFPVRYFKSKGFDVQNPKWFTFKKPIRIDDVLRYFTVALQNEKPDVIVGFSAGGLIAPHVANLFPESKLILIATGPRLNPKSEKVKVLFTEIDTKLIFFLLKVASFVPRTALRKIYKKMYPNNTDLHTHAYEKDMDRNLDAIKNIDECLKDTADFIRTIDNTSFLPNIKNKTLIVSGNEDVLMPVNLGNELNHLIKNSVFHTTRASHFDVFNRESIIYVDDFLDKIL